jgi:hypothetical protein
LTQDALSVLQALPFELCAEKQIGDAVLLLGGQVHYFADGRFKTLRHAAS